MSKGTRATRTLLNDKCRAMKITEAGQTLVCWKAPGHVGSRHSHRREHYDPSADVRWTD